LAAGQAKDGMCYGWQQIQQPSTDREVDQRREPVRLELPKPIVTSQTQFEVPFNTDDTTGRLIEVQLYVSTDLGKSWNLYARQSPLVKRIPFQSVGDGDYLFALKTLDRDGQLLPTGPPMPTLRIAIDTQKPELQMRIDPDKSGRIAATWRAEDFNLDVESITLSYRVAAPNEPATWHPIPTGSSNDQKQQAEPGLFQDRIVWWPNTQADAIVVKLEVKDRAGNLSTVFQPVGLSALRPANPMFNVGHPLGNTLTPPKPNQLASDGPNSGEANASSLVKETNANNPPANVSVNWPVDPLREGIASNLPSRFKSLEAGLAFDLQQPTSDADPRQSHTDPFGAMMDPTKPSGAANAGNMSVTVGSTLAPNNQSSADQDQRSHFIPESTLAKQKQAFPSLGTTSTDAPNFGSNPQGFQSMSSRSTSPSGVPATLTSAHPLASGSGNQETVSSLGGLTPSGNSTGGLPVSNATQVKPAAPNPEDASQFAPGTYFLVNQKRFRLRYQVDGLQPSQIGSVAIFGSTDQGQSWRLWTSDLDKVSPVEIQVNDEGRYSFRVVVTSVGGITSDIPRAGTQPELTVDVDLTAPVPKIVAAPYGRDPSQASLQIQWECDATDLGEQPVAIAFSASASGPWTTITTATQNSGQFQWDLQPNLPKQVYLRMAIRDLAGNKGFHQLDRPINIAHLIPRGRILGLEK